MLFRIDGRRIERAIREKKQEVEGEGGVENEISNNSQKMEIESIQDLFVNGDLPGRD